MGGWWSRVPGSRHPRAVGPHAACSAPRKPPLTWAQPYPPRETPEPREGMADGALAGEEDTPPCPGARVGPGAGAAGGARAAPSTGSSTGGTAGAAVPAALTQPCRRLLLLSPLQEGPEAPGPSWDLASASPPAQAEAFGAVRGRDPTGLALGGQQASARHPAEPQQSLGPEARPPGLRDHTGGPGPQHLCPGADLPPCGHLTRDPALGQRM